MEKTLSGHIHDALSTVYGKAQVGARSVYHCAIMNFAYVPKALTMQERAEAFVANPYIEHMGAVNPYYFKASGLSDSAFKRCLTDIMMPSILRGAAAPLNYAQEDIATFWVDEREINALIKRIPQNRMLLIAQRSEEKLFAEIENVRQACAYGGIEETRYLDA